MTDDLLLDTCAAIWLVEGAPLSDAAITAFNRSAAAGKATYASVVTAWEIGMLMSRGRLPSPVSPLAWYQRLLDLPLIAEAALSADILIASSYLPGIPHGDPFDRVILATARERGLTILTRDRKILAYAEAGHVAAIEC